ncbi:MAG: NrdH-redoxin [Spirochaetes bacterium GWF1_41_5]|nr:MAG: NrdH-redoxin [Spirochaetes bacterium GWF1_41_5]
MSIKLYSTPSCGYCKLAKSFLRERGVQFTEYDVSVDQRRAEEMLAKSRQQGVPVLDINGSVVIGFDKPRIENLLQRIKK